MPELALSINCLILLILLAAFIAFIVSEESVTEHAKGHATVECVHLGNPPNLIVRVDGILSEPYALPKRHPALQLKDGERVLVWFYYSKKKSQLTIMDIDWPITPP